VKLTFEPDDIDILQGITEESSEHLRGVEDGILKMEADFDPDTVDSVFRALHSVKGVAGLLDLAPIRDCAHCLESLLMDIRRGLFQPDAVITDILLRGVDILHLQLSELSAQLQELQADPPSGPFVLDIPEAGCEELAASVEEIRSQLAGCQSLRSALKRPANSPWTFRVSWSRCFPTSWMKRPNTWLLSRVTAWRWKSTPTTEKYSTP